MAPPVRWTAVLVLLGLWLFGFWPVRHASAATLVVGPGGFATVQQAVNRATPGTAILIAPGSYNETVNLSLMGSAAGSTTGALALIAQQGPGTVTLGGSGVKIINSAAFNGSLLLDGLRFSSSDDDTIRLNSFSDLVIVNSSFQTVGNSNLDNAIELAISVAAPTATPVPPTGSAVPPTPAPVSPTVTTTPTPNPVADPDAAMQYLPLVAPGPPRRYFP